MLRRSKIGWCDYSAGDLNFIIGCTPVSEACKNCYARAWAKQAGRDFSNVRVYWEKLNRLWRAKWEPGDTPYRRGPGSKPIMFPVDLGDLFHPDVPEEMVLTSLDIFAARDDADWVLLTKRPERMLDISSYWLDLYDLEVLPSNIWCLVTAETQQRADERIPILVQVKAQVRGVSIEPMLESIEMKHWLGWWNSNQSPRPSGQHGYPGDLSWVIVGAESGPKRRGFERWWAGDLYRQCQSAGVPFFGKQDSHLRPDYPLLLKGKMIKEFPKLARGSEG